MLTYLPKPRAATSVATRIGARPDRNSERGQGYPLLIPPHTRSMSSCCKSTISLDPSNTHHLRPSLSLAEIYHHGYT